MRHVFFRTVDAAGVAPGFGEAPVRICVAVGLLLAGVSVAAGVTPAVFVAPDLSRERVRLSNLGDSEVSYFDAQGRRVTRPTRELMAILWPQQRSSSETDTEPAASSAVMSLLFPPRRVNAGGSAEHSGALESLDSGGDVVELVDRQRWVGRWTGVRETGLVFRSRSLETERVFPLERVLRIGPRGAAADDDDAGGDGAGQDVVTLTNDDRLAGFLIGLTDTAVELIPEGGTQPIPLPRERIAAMKLANPVEPPDPELHTLHLRDGSRLGVQTPRTQGESLAFRLAGAGPDEQTEEIRVPLSRVHRLDFTGHGRRLLPMTRIDPQLLGGGSYFGVPAPPRAVNGDLLLHAPITLSYPLDPLARRFAARAVLDLPEELSQTQRRLAGLRLGLTVNGGDTRWWTLDADDPEVTINQALPPASAGPVTLQLELDPHVNGPVLDRLRLEDPRLLLVRPGVSEK